MNRAQRALADRIFNRLMREGLIVFEPGSKEAAQRAIDEEVSK